MTAIKVPWERQLRLVKGWWSEHFIKLILASRFKEPSLSRFSIEHNPDDFGVDLVVTCSNGPIGFEVKCNEALYNDHSGYQGILVKFSRIGRDGKLHPNMLCEGEKYHDQGYSSLTLAYIDGVTKKIYWAKDEKLRAIMSWSETSNAVKWKDASFKDVSHSELTKENWMNYSKLIKRDKVYWTNITSYAPYAHLIPSEEWLNVRAKELYEKTCNLDKDLRESAEAEFREHFLRELEAKDRI